MAFNEEYIHRIILDEVNQLVTFTPNKYNVITTFNKINNACFKNSLKLCPINLKLKKNYLGYFKYDGYDGNGGLINPILSINGAYEYNMVQFESVVAHEMIHYYLAKIGLDPKCGHGQEFKQLANTINTQFGLSIDETVDTGNMTYGGNSNNYVPNKQVIGKLKAYYSAINQYNNQMKKDIGNKNGEIALFMQTLYSFDIALLNAIKRCVSKNSLNEGGEFTKAMGDFRHGYNKGYNWMLDILTKKRNDNFNGGKNANSAAFNNNASLMELLFNVFPYNIEKKFDTINNKTMNLLSSISSVDSLITTIRDMGGYVENEINNAQGINP